MLGTRDLALNPYNPVCTKPHTPAREVLLLLRVKRRHWSPDRAGQGPGAPP